MISNRSKAAMAAAGLILAGVLLPAATVASAAPLPTATPSDAVCEYFYGDRPTMSYGSSGPAVAQAQCELNDVIGAGLVIDGAFGSATEKATKAFQAKCRLSKDGIIGPKTWARLNDAF